MKRSDAYKLGVESALEAAMYGTYLDAELADRESFVAAILEVCDNKRQYAGHPGYEFNQQKNGSDLWDAFERGELAGAKRSSLRMARKEAALMRAVHCGKG